MSAATIITGYEIPAKENPFTKIVEQLIKDADKSPAAQIHGAAEKGSGTPTFASEAAKFRSAAREAGYTGKLVETEEGADEAGEFIVGTFILAPKRERKPNKGKGDSDAK